MLIIYNIVTLCMKISKLTSYLTQNRVNKVKIHLVEYGLILI